MSQRDGYGMLQRSDCVTTHLEYRVAIKQLGLSQIGAARLLGVDRRTSRRWANDERVVPQPAARFLRYLIATNKSGEQAMRILGRKTP